MVGSSGRSAWSRFQSTLDARHTAVDSLQEQVNDVNFAIDRGKIAARRLESWRARSLPADPELASSLYQDWLGVQLQQAGIENFDIKLVAESQALRSVGLRQLSFRVNQAVGELDGVVKFLYAFYTAPHLHKISSLTVTPEDDGRRLRIIGMRIDTLILPGADQTASLAVGALDRLDFDELDTYLANISARNVFTVYTPPRPAPPSDVAVDQGPPPPPGIDDAEHAYVSGIAQAGPKLQVWIRVMTTGQTFYLLEGDSFEIGRLKGEVVKIDPQARKIVIATSDGPIAVAFGNNLRDGSPLAGESGDTGA